MQDYPVSRGSYLVSENCLFFVEFVDGFHQPLQGVLDGGIPQLSACGGCVAAAAQGLQDHLHIGGADAPGGNIHRAAVGIEHEGGADAGNIQQLISCLGRQHPGGFRIQGGNNGKRKP